MSSIRLTLRERQVAELLVEGLGDKQIGAQLGIADQTVKFHMTRMRAKLGAGNRVKAAVMLVRQGIIP